MQITESQIDLAHDLLWACEQLGGPTYTETDIERVAAGIAQRAWLERQFLDLRFSDNQ